MPTPPQQDRHPPRLPVHPAGWPLRPGAAQAGPAGQPDAARVAGLPAGSAAGHPAQDAGRRGRLGCYGPRQRQPAQGPPGCRGGDHRQQRLYELAPAHGYQVVTGIRWARVSGGYGYQVGMGIRWVWVSGGCKYQVGTDIRWVRISGGYGYQVGTGIRWVRVSGR